MADDFSTKAADIVKKIMTVGVGAIFLTEESLRALVSEFKLPKEMLAGVLDSASKTRDEFLRHFAREIVSQLMEKVEPSELLAELLRRNQIDVDLSLNFKPKKP